MKAGTSFQPRLSQVIPMLIPEAQRAARQARFSPTRLGGQAGEGLGSDHLQLCIEQVDIDPPPSKRYGNPAPYLSRLKTVAQKRTNQNKKMALLF